MALPATYAFTAAENPLSATYWGQCASLGALRATGGVCIGANSAADCIMYWSADAPNANQYCKITHVTCGGNTIGGGPGVRITSSGGYYLYNEGVADSQRVYRFSGTTITQIGSEYTESHVDGVVLMLGITGVDNGTLTPYFNGSALATQSDGTWDSGSGGISLYSNNATNTFDTWECGNLDSPTIEQEGFRFRNDDGSESAATWKANQDTNITLAADTAARIRILLNATGDPASIGAQLEYRYKPSGGAFGAWGKVVS